MGSLEEHESPIKFDDGRVDKVVISVKYCSFFLNFVSVHHIILIQTNTRTSTQRRESGEGGELDKEGYFFVFEFFQRRNDE